MAAAMPSDSNSIRNLTLPHLSTTHHNTHIEKELESDVFLTLTLTLAPHPCMPVCTCAKYSLSPRYTQTMRTHMQHYCYKIKKTTCRPNLRTKIRNLIIIQITGTSESLVLRRQREVVLLGLLRAIERVELRGVRQKGELVHLVHSLFHLRHRYSSTGNDCA